MNERRKHKRTTSAQFRRFYLKIVLSLVMWCSILLISIFCVTQQMPDRYCFIITVGSIGSRTIRHIGSRHSRRDNERNHQSKLPYGWSCVFGTRLFLFSSFSFVLCFFLVGSMSSKLVFPFFTAIYYHSHNIFTAFSVFILPSALFLVIVVVESDFSRTFMVSHAYILFFFGWFVQWNWEWWTEKCACVAA